MKLFSVSIGQTIILTLLITFSSSAHTNLSEPVDSTPSTTVRFLETFVEYWHSLENTIISNFHNLVESFENIFYCSPHQAHKFNYDVTLVGFVNFADGIGRHPILFKDCLENSARMNFVSTRDIPADVEDAQLGLPRLNPTEKEDIGAISILTDIISDRAVEPYKKVPESVIKIAYSMFESTRIPQNWTKVLNKKFDATVVPDPSLIDVYKKSGVKIPIFVLPLPLILKDFLKLEQPTVPHKPFVFGMVGGFWNRKNHMRVLEAFAAEFGNRSDVKLKLHGRFGEESIINALEDKIKEYNLTNVELIVGPYSWDEYIDFYKSLDCYVLLSMGEGFSITPREALACGKPCILTKNTAQITLCSVPGVRAVLSDILVPAIYDCHYDSSYITDSGLDYTAKFLQMSDTDLFNTTLLDDEDALSWRSSSIGYQFDCKVLNARRAMRDVYKNYSKWVKKAQKGREWVTRYLAENLTNKYISLVKPQSIVLGEENIIGDTFLMTTSKELYEKYQSIIGN